MGTLPSIGDTFVFTLLRAATRALDLLPPPVEGGIRMKDFAKPGFAPGKGIVIGGEANGLTVLAGTLLAAALAKSLVLFLVGPSIQPDSAEYLGRARR